MAACTVLWPESMSDSLIVHPVRGISVERSETTSARTLAVLAALWRRMAAAEAPSVAAPHAGAMPVCFLEVLNPGPCLALMLPDFGGASAPFIVPSEANSHCWRRLVERHD